MFKHAMVDEEQWCVVMFPIGTDYHLVQAIAKHLGFPLVHCRTDENWYYQGDGSWEDRNKWSRLCKFSYLSISAYRQVLLTRISELLWQLHDVQRDVEEEFKRKHGYYPIRIRLDNI